MNRQRHDLPCIKKPPPFQPTMLALYNARLERERQAVDIDEIHHKRGLVAPHLRRPA